MRRRLVALLTAATACLLVPTAARAGTGSLAVVSHGSGGVNPILHASVTLTRSDCDASGNCDWYAYVIEQPIRQGPCAASASTQSGPTPPDRLVDLVPQNVSSTGPGASYSGPGTVQWAFTVARADIPRPARLCLYVALPDDTTGNGLMAQTTYSPRPPRRDGTRHHRRRHRHIRRPRPSRP